MARDDFSQEVKDELARRVNFRCSNPGCWAQTSGPRTDVTKSVSVGVAAHITAASPGGKRFNSNISKKERSSITNGIWLCQICAKRVDNDEENFETLLLQQWKKISEKYATEQLGKPIPILNSAISKNMSYWELSSESNSRFGFSFVYPSLWDRQDPTNSDGNRFLHPTDPLVEMTTWGGYAILSPDLSTWIEQTVAFAQENRKFQLLKRVAAGGHVFDWIMDSDRKTPIETRQQVEGCRIVFSFEENDSQFTSMQTFLQYDNTQIGLICKSASSDFERYEELFITLSKGLRVLGFNSAPFARGGERKA